LAKYQQGKGQERLPLFVVGRRVGLTCTRGRSGEDHRGSRRVAERIEQQREGLSRGKDLYNHQNKNSGAHTGTKASTKPQKSVRKNYVPCARMRNARRPSIL